MGKRLMTFKNTFSVKYFSLLLLIFWTVALLISLAWALRNERLGLLAQATIQARTVYQKDTLFRQWAASHGGVYVPVDEHTPPNPFLEDIPERDILTPSGRQLTLINPAYIMRQVNELAYERQEVLGHLTSLNPLRAENAPDAWEAEALRAFEEGATEVVALSPVGGQDYMRLMRPFYTEESCLKCHAEQGYVLGDIRGGISVSIPMAPFWAHLGKARSQEITAHLLLWLLGVFGGALGTGRLLVMDKKRREAEDALKESLLSLENRVKERTVELENAWDHVSSIIQSTPDIMLVANLENHVILLNQHAEDFLGIHFTECRRKTILDVLQPCLAGEFPEDFAARNPDGPTDINLFDRTQNEVRTFQLTVSDVKRKGTETVGHIFNLRDVTRVRESDRLKSEFIMTAAHELNTPLAAVMGYAELLLDSEWQRGVSLEQQRECLSIIHEKGAHLEQIVDELLLLSRLEAGRKVNLEMAYTDVDGELNLLIQQFQKENPRYEFILELPEEGSPIVFCDRHKINQVFENLLSNAVKYSPEGCAIHVSSWADEREVSFSVTDSGIGMTPEQVQRVFDKFYRVDTSNTAVGGLGLGMTIVRTIIEGHNGRIHIDSAPGRGTCVMFSIPRFAQVSPSLQSPLVALNGNSVQ